MNNKLESLMNDKGVGVSELARAIKASRSTIYRTLDGGTPSAGLMFKLAEYFGVDPSEIFFAPSVRHVVRNEGKSA